MMMILDLSKAFYVNEKEYELDNQETLEKTSHTSALCAKYTAFTRGIHSHELYRGSPCQVCLP
jgi:hypothetical protein